MNRTTTHDRITCVILDWAGTIVDFGCRAPVSAFITTLSEAGIMIGEAAARGPMGLEKRAHLRELLALPDIAAQWTRRHGTPPDDAALDRLFERFRVVQRDGLADHADLIPGLLPAIAALRAGGIRIGSNSGYDRSMIDSVASAAAKAGFIPDAITASDEVARSRPFPDIAWHVATKLGAAAARFCVKVDDTPVGIAEGVNAGMWSIGITDSGNEIGLARDDWEALAPDEAASRRHKADAALSAAGAHLVINTIADLPAAIQILDAQLATGARP